MKRLLNNLLLILSGILAGGLIWLISRPPRGAPVELRPAPTQTPLWIHVTGAVAEPGVYELAPGARVKDAIAAAGGFLPGGESGALNLAAPLADGQQIAVPDASAAAAPEEPAERSSSEQPAGALVNINTATAAELEALPGIGPTIAQRIVDYREENGPFEKAADILNVSGIGPATFAQFKDLITAGP
jgi:competence protein ComEA